MSLLSPKALLWMNTFPKSVSALTVSLAALAFLLVLSSSLSAIASVSSTFQGYFNGLYGDREAQFGYSGHQTVINNDREESHQNLDRKGASGSSNFSVTAPFGSNNKWSITAENENSSVGSMHGSVTSNTDNNLSANEINGSGMFNYVTEMTRTSSEYSASSCVRMSMLVREIIGLGHCDLYHGKWFYDPSGPLYTNNTCPIITQMQNCQGNGRPDQEYENWRWRPNECDLPRFDGKKFLELMSGKTLAFVGDSVARNQMESLLCILWQVEAPKNRGNRKMHRWFFPSHSVMIMRIWSSWLVHQMSEAFDFAPGGVDKLHLDKPDQTFMELLPSIDVLVLSSGHWFAKQSVYILNNEIVGGQLWWPDVNRTKKINNIQAYGISVETSLSAIVTHPSFKGLAIVRSYSPDHYEGGAWNAGGSCTGKVKPLTEGELVENGFTQRMHEQQVMGFQRAQKRSTNKSKLRLMDITEVFSYRADGHPGPYRSLDPNKITKRSPDGRPPPQDCLHWCMPGPVDTWNEIVFEIIRREFQQAQELSERR